MTFTEQLNIVIIIIASVLTGISGYVSRIAQKFEDRRDDIKLRSLPLIKHNLIYITKSFDLYNGKNDFQEFYDSLCNSIGVLDKEISSGNILLSKLEVNRVNQFFWNLKILSKTLDGIKNSDNRKNDLVNALKYGNEQHKAWLQINPLDIKNDIHEIIRQIDKEVRGYVSWSKRIIILLMIIGVMVGLVTFINQTFGLLIN